MTLGYEYLKVMQERFNSVKDLGEKTIDQLSDDDIHWVLNDSSNSIVVIVKHLNGNMTSRWTDFLTTDGEKPNRNREQEFDDTLTSKLELKTSWEQGWAILFEALNSLQKEDLLKTVYIRGEGHTALDAIERQLAHYAYHIGQIVFIGKQLKGTNWDSLSIPSGKSKEYLEQMMKQNAKN